jgi:hypothetical protein
MTLKEWVLDATRIDESEVWATLKVNVPKRTIFRDSFLGPWVQPIPDDVVIAPEEESLVLESHRDVVKWLDG